MSPSCNEIVCARGIPINLAKTEAIACQSDQSHQERLEKRTEVVLVGEKKFIFFDASEVFTP